MNFENLKGTRIEKYRGFKCELIYAVNRGKENFYEKWVMERDDGIVLTRTGDYWDVLECIDRFYGGRET